MESWLSIHLFYAEPWEQLLLQVVKPVCRELCHQHLISQYFFIRYWEGGPHIRLRVKGNSEVLKSHVEPLIRQYFEQFTTTFPSLRLEPEQASNLPGHHPWYPNNSFQLIDYEPETERYGGIYGIPVAERQFEVSSRAVIEAIASSKMWNTSRALGVAIQMHLGFAFGIGMQRKEAALFFSWITHQWLPSAYYYGQSLTKEDHQRAKRKMLDCFQDQYRQQEKHLLPFCLKFWKGLQSASFFEQEWIHQWVHEMRSIGATLKAQHQTHKLIMPAWICEDAIPSSDAILWGLYDSFIHMTNNRLGVLNRDEAYIAFLIKETLAQLH